MKILVIVSSKMKRCDWGEDMSSGMDNGRGENGFKETMGLKEKMFTHDKNLWGKICIIGMDSDQRGDGAKEMWFEEMIFPQEKVGLRRSFSLRIVAEEEMGSGKGCD